MSVPNPILKTGESFVLLERVLGGGIESLVKLASSAMDGDVALGHCRLMGKSNEYVFKGGLEFVDVPIIDAVWHPVACRIALIQDKALVGSFGVRKSPCLRSLRIGMLNSPRGMLIPDEMVSIRMII